MLIALFLLLCSVERSGRLGLHANSSLQVHYSSTASPLRVEVQNYKLFFMRMKNTHTAVHGERNPPTDNCRCFSFILPYWLALRKNDPSCS